MIAAGIDIGSAATKVTLLRDGGVAGRAVRPTGGDPRATWRAVLREALAEAGLPSDASVSMVSTGYGRHVVEGVERAVTEITCAARGAALASDGDPPRAIIDVGGQDTKVILLEADGQVRDFAMNDKCAAGTGRFLEVMARVLGVELDALGRLSAEAKSPSPISATCTVFAESEVISLLHTGAAPADIVAGLHLSVASRVVSMMPRLRDVSPALFIGGGARDEGLRAALEDALGAPVVVPAEPQFVVSLGAASIADGGQRAPCQSIGGRG